MESNVSPPNLATIYLPTRMELIRLINRMRKSLGITQEDLANLINSNKVRLSRIIGKNPRTASYDELMTIFNFLQAKKSPLPPDLTVRKFFQNRGQSRPLISVTLQDPVVNAIFKMKENDFSQLPVFNQQSQCLGIISDHGIVRKIHEFGFELKDKKIFDIQDVIEGVPFIKYDSILIEAILILDLYYAVLVKDREEVTDILTRNDLVRLCLLESEY